jgi:hypothetical protein
VTDDPDHLPCLVIPPDHPLAEKLFDAVTDEEAIAVIDAYREEVGRAARAKGFADVQGAPRRGDCAALANGALTGRHYGPSEH